jgi:hypothetical protein
MSLDLYAEVTGQIVTMLGKGVVPWRSPILGRSRAGHPNNLDSGKAIPRALIAFYEDLWPRHICLTRVDIKINSI